MIYCMTQEIMTRNNIDEFEVIYKNVTIQVFTINCLYVGVSNLSDLYLSNSILNFCTILVCTILYHIGMYHIGMYHIGMSFFDYLVFMEMIYGGQETSFNRTGTF